MRDRIVLGRSMPRAVTMAAAVVLLTLGGARAGEMAQSKKDHAPKAAPSEEEPPPVHYIRCANVIGASPCAPDSAMQRLNGSPQLERPERVPGDQPNFAPAR